MAVCARCGEKNARKANFCSACGYDLRQQEEQPAFTRQAFFPEEGPAARQQEGEQQPAVPMGEPVAAEEGGQKAKEEFAQGIQETIRSAPQQEAPAVPPPLQNAAAQPGQGAAPWQPVPPEWDARQAEVQQAAPTPWDAPVQQANPPQWEAPPPQPAAQPRRLAGTQDIPPVPAAPRKRRGGALALAIAAVLVFLLAAGVTVVVQLMPDAVDAALQALPFVGGKDGSAAPETDADPDGEDSLPSESAPDTESAMPAEGGGSAVSSAGASEGASSPEAPGSFSVASSSGSSAPAAETPAEFAAKMGASDIDAVLQSYYQSYLACLNDGSTAPLEYATEACEMEVADRLDSPGNTVNQFTYKSAACLPDTVKAGASGGDPSVEFEADFQYDYKPKDGTGALKTGSNKQSVQMLYVDGAWKVNKFVYVDG